MTEGKKVRRVEVEKMKENYKLQNTKNENV
jgi:hypothetical protein